MKRTDKTMSVLFSSVGIPIDIPNEFLEKSLFYFMFYVRHKHIYDIKTVCSVSISIESITLIHHHIQYETIQTLMALNQKYIWCVDSENNAIYFHSNDWGRNIHISTHLFTKRRKTFAANHYQDIRDISSTSINCQLNAKHDDECHQIRIRAQCTHIKGQMWQIVYPESRRYDKVTLAFNTVFVHNEMHAVRSVAGILLKSLFMFLKKNTKKTNRWHSRSWIKYFEE